MKRTPRAMQRHPEAHLPMDHASLRIVESAPCEPAPADAAGAAWMLPDLHRRVVRIEELLRLLPIILAAAGVDSTHLSVEASARALGTSVKSVRRKIATGFLTLETIPGTRKTGIRIEQVYDGWWVPLSLSRRLIEDERHELEDLKRKSR
jgi:hypothetical protein